VFFLKFQNREYSNPIIFLKVCQTFLSKLLLNDYRIQIRLTIVSRLFFNNRRQ